MEAISYQIVENYLKTCDNTQKSAVRQGDNYGNICLLDCPYFKKYYKLIAINLSK